MSSAEPSLVPDEVGSGSGDEGGESGDEVERLEQDVGGTVGIRTFELVDDEAVAVEA